MSVNNNQTAQSANPSMFNQVLSEGKNMATGALAGAAVGKGVSLVLPVSHKQIAAQISDHFIKNNTEGIGDLLKKAADLEIIKFNHDAAADYIKQIGEMSAQSFTEATDGIKAVLKGLGKELPEGAEFTKDSVVSAFKQFIKDNPADEKEIKTLTDNIDKTLKTIQNSATEAVEKFFKTPRKERVADDIVGIAKKCAKKAQAGKIIGIGILAGICTMLFNGMFSSKSSKIKEAQEATQQAALSKIQTHQG